MTSKLTRALGALAAAALAAAFTTGIGAAAAAAPPSRAAATPAAAVTCAGSAATIVGTPGNDVINGTAGNDIIQALGGDDVVNGLGGDDVICGGDGNDTLNGGTGFDSFIGEPGDDHVDGGTGLINGVNINGINFAFSPNGVRVDLGRGTATGQGNDTLTNLIDVSGSPFNDQLIGDGQNNFIIGDGGSDTLAGGAGDDFLTAQSNGPSDRSFLIPGPGNDRMSGDGKDAVADYIDCTGLTVDLAAGTAACGGQGNDTFFGVDDVLGSQFDDTIVGNAHDNRLFGLAGNDNISGAGGNDLITAGDGNDAVNGGDGADIMSYADAPGEVIANIGAGAAVGNGTDTMTNVEGLTGGPQHDVLVGGPADDVIDGGAGSDTIDGAGGSNTVSYASSQAPVTVDLAFGAAVGAGTDTLQHIANIVGSPVGGNMLRGDDNPNRITGFAGDTIEGRGGNDVFHAPSEKSVTLWYGPPTSGVTVNVDAGTATGGAGNDTFDFVPGTIVGSKFADHISCTTSTPTNGCLVDGRGGNDTITGTPGNDTLRGGSGDDRLTGNGGQDTADYSTGAAVNVNLATGRATGQGTDTLVAIASAIGSPNNDTLVGPATAPCALHGGAGDDHLSATANGCLLDGGAGNDTITGTAGGDFIVPGDGNDTVNAGAGNDLVGGDSGDDHLDGGTGTDTLDVSQTATVLNVDLASGAVTGVGTDTAVGFENLNAGFGDDTIRGTTGANTIHGGGGDDTIFGRDGNDRLFGDIGNDTVNADAGNDTVDGGDGNDTLAGGSGTDTVAYTRVDDGVTVDLANHIAFSTGVDSLQTFENITGSPFDDTLTGDPGPNVINGGLGTDTCDGGGGTDTLLNCP